MADSYQQRGNPRYPKLRASERWKLGRELTPDEKYRHGEEVLAEIGRLNQAESNRRAGVNVGHRACPCASGTWLSGGEAILKAVGRQNLAALHNWKPVGWS
jgi:hypothetical protein